MTEESSAAPVKKGRGRPRKTETVAKPTNEKKKPAKEVVELPPESAEDTTETDDDVLPVKSPTGKKRAAPAERQETNKDAGEPAPKKRPGRPPKANKKKNVPTSTGRGRGRPRKNP
uniref:Uncharacterized protein n=1 Tax=Anopheles culicifacies TaxID=139723 RepID=A0A182LSU0_9DIPT